MPSEHCQTILLLDFEYYINSLKTVSSRMPSCVDITLLFLKEEKDPRRDKMQGFHVNFSFSCILVKAAFL